MDVALASCLELPEPDPDEAPLAAALGAAGLDCRVLAWDDPAAEWSAARLTLLRATWNYPQAPQAFLAWAEATAAVSALWNPLELVRWNLHKGYLVDLEQRGVAITPTELVPRGSSRTLAEVAGRRGWTDLVVKPAISASSYRTQRIAAGALAAGERHLRSLVSDRDALVQSYLPSVEDYGERSLVWIDGALTHAVRKSPRFEGHHEAVSAAVAIAPAEAVLAERAVEEAAAIAGATPLYARIDLAPDPSGEPVLMELELIEPSLFFLHNPAALERMVAAVRTALG